MRAPSSRRVSLIGVVSAGDLAERLRREGQDEWCTRVRLGGLLLLIDFLCRNHTVGGFPLPADLADGFISKLGKPKSRRTMREPLAVLCHVGILRRVRAALNGWHLRTPAVCAWQRVCEAARHARCGFAALLGTKARIGFRASRDEAQPALSISGPAFDGLQEAQLRSRFTAADREVAGSSGFWILGEARNRSR